MELFKQGYMSNYVLFFSGLHLIHKLESLSLAHNLLDSEAISSGGIALLHHLKKLDLSHNLLTQVPPIISNMKR